MTISPISSFNLAAPTLETGRVVIEASAGTGKTYSLTVLAIRHVAERHLTADQLLMVTFTIAATAELREKTRDQARQTLKHLRNKSLEHQWMTTMLATEETRLVAISNLEHFLATFDQATITTIHGFCQLVLKRAGLHSPTPPNYTVQDNVDEIINQVITDLLIDPMSVKARLLHGEMNKQGGGIHLLKAADVRKSLSNLHDAVKRFMGNPQSLLLPAVAPDEFSTKIESLKNEKDIKHTQQAEIITKFVKQVVVEVQRRSYDAGIITYDDMVRMVAETLNRNDGVAKSLATSIATQYSLVMVDEFQDTDASQWSIFSHIYEANPKDVTLITVGDPKQAIYRFRGADVQVYIDAVRSVRQSHALNTNYRSDKRLLTALEALLNKNTFDGAGNVPFMSVNAAKNNEHGAIIAQSATAPTSVPGAPLEIRYLANDADLEAREELGKIKKDGKPGKSNFFNNDNFLVQHIFWCDVANHVVELLQHGSIPDKTTTEVGATRAITPNDIAILVNSHNDAKTAVRYLLKAHVPAVRFKTDSVFGSQAAMHWLMLLGALANPGKPQFVRAYALSWFGNVSEEDLALATEETVATWQRDCAENAELLQSRGVSALFLSFRNRAGFLRRVLSELDGERHITDLDHLAEILATIPHFTHNAGAGECFETLSELVEESDGRNEAFQRRIEGDKIAVKVMTIHSSKGLQFPIVFLPTLLKLPNNKNNNPKMFSFSFPDELSARRIIDVASGYDAAKDWVFDPTGNEDPLHAPIRIREDGREVLFKDDVYYDSKRLLYVALTRAEHKVVIYWSATGPHNGNGNINVALAQVLAAHIDPVDKKIPVDKDSLDALMQKLISASQGTIAAIPLPTKSASVLTWGQPKLNQLGTTHPAQFSRTKEVRTYGFARWSYSAFSKLLDGDNQINNVVDINGATDESNIAPVLPPLVKEVNIPLDIAVDTMPLYNIAGSNIFGDAVHKIYDNINPASESLNAEVLNEVEQYFKNMHSPAERLKIAEGIIASILAPLGEPFAGNTLQSLGVTHRLSELEFNFHLPQTADDAFSLSRIGELMLQHGKLDARLTAYAQDIADSASAGMVAGFMTGFIDAVFRVNWDGNPVYVVADYKTNKLHKPANKEENPLIAYHPDNLVISMVERNYIIQALVYSVALHRYLRWRQPGYDPNIHLGGAAYLFTRGMTGHSTNEPTPRPYGVYHWRPSTELVLALDALFAEKGN